MKEGHGQDRVDVAQRSALAWKSGPDDSFHGIRNALVACLSHRRSQANQAPDKPNSSGRALNPVLSEGAFGRLSRPCTSYGAVAAGEASSAVPKLRAFLVEDSPMVLETLSAALAEVADVNVVGSASTQRDALDWFGSRTNGCDVAVIDVFLKSGSGLAILEVMQTYDAPPERVVLTNYSTPDMRARCKALGAEKVFDKSIELEEMLAWLQERKVQDRRPLRLVRGGR